MKKYLKILLPLLLLIITLSCCFLIYVVIAIRKADTAPIHSNSNWVIKIDGIELSKILYKELLWEDAHRKLVDSTQFRVVKGMTIPLNIYVFNTHKNPNTFYTSTLLNDEKVLISNLEHENSWNKIDSTPIVHLYRHQYLNVHISYNKSRVFFIWNLDVNTGIDELQDLIDNRHCIQYNKSVYRQSLKTNNVASASNTKDFFELNFKEGAIIVSGKLNWRKSKHNAIHLKNAINNTSFNFCLHSSTSIDYLSWLKFFPEFENLATHLLDSSQDINMNIAMDKSKIIHYNDSLAIVEFDDYGNKMRKIVTEESSMPLLVFSVANYSKWENIIYPYNNKIQEQYFSIFPIYLHVQSNTLIGSNSNKIHYLETSNDKDCGLKLFLKIDDKLKQTSWHKEYNLSDLFEDINIEGIYLSNDILEINGKINMENKSKNALKSIYNYIK